MLLGAHAIIYSKDADADRAFLRDVLGLPHVDVGGGWLVFGLPPAEVAVHPANEGGTHELYLMTDDVEAFVATMKRHGRTCTPISAQGWGMLTSVSLPGGGTLGVYQPRHASPPMARGKNAGKARAAAKQRARAKRAPAKRAPARRAPAKRATTKRSSSRRTARARR